ncbi:hypothetical protein Hs30E_09530 [Lactococcus hodotermopsidis]|uniref:AprE-like beta-barrel domain-containing protein n=1 Tax=Pseudolactococcus hodotermopsidis TaxID=2709157 RepID=A0A6A0BAI3_9LACT|nr:HlyD family efflux transporter periplasmic adaptor subunit [Lactococcus hodotermopsidis]GFH42402.1 hypothetical protein Hs30E_09530 [Lactococcus hodotermopsidis]
MKLYSKEELKDSRLFFDKRPANFAKFLAMFMMIMIVGSFVSLRFIKKNDIIRGQGTIETADKVYITPLVNGNVISIDKPEGSRVEKGDKLLTLSTGNETVLLDNIDDQLKKMDEKIAIFDKYEKALNEKENTLNNSGIEQEFYGKVALYLSQISQENKQKNDTSQALAARNAELAKLQGELATIQGSDTGSLRQEYEKAYNRKVEDIAEAEKLNEAALVKSLTRELEDLNAEYARTAGESSAAKQAEITAKQAEVSSLETALYAQADQTYQQLISELGTMRRQVQDEKAELARQQTLKKSENGQLDIVADHAGTIHYFTALKKGLGLQAFQPIADVSDDGKAKELFVESYISAQDRTRIKIGNSVKVSVNGVNQTDYGLLSGKVTAIANGTVTQSESGTSQVLYQVTVKLSQNKLKDIDLLPSMPVMINVVYHQETYLSWLLEQLNFMK